MKNRYFGDIYDYVKYALIRQLTDSGDTAAVVCWMLTDDDGGKDGHRTEYLRDPGVWRSFAPSVFDFLQDQVVGRKVRNVKAIEEGSLIPNCRFFSKILTDDPAHREEYFEQFLEFASNAGFVFFDPDNGVEIKSVKYGKKKSSKYLFWDEVDRANDIQRSLLIYQHLPPKPRRPLIERIADDLLQVCRRDIIFAIQSAKVAFFLVPNRDSIPTTRRSVSAIETKWEGFLKVSEHHLI